jgi:hypothetical protein
MGSRGVALPICEPRHEEGMGWLAPRRALMVEIHENQMVMSPGCVQDY